MGKRSNFERVPRDYYPTPIHAVGEEKANPNSTDQVKDWLFSISVTIIKILNEVNLFTNKIYFIKTLF